MEGLTPIQNAEWESVLIPISKPQAWFVQQQAIARMNGKHRPETTRVLNERENAPLFFEEIGIAGECAFVTVLKESWIKFDADFLTQFATPDFKVYDQRDRWEFWDIKTQSSAAPFVVWRAWQVEKWKKKRESQREAVLIFARVESAPKKWSSPLIEERIAGVRFLGCMPCDEFLERAAFHTEGKMGGGRLVKDPCYEMPVSDLYTIQSLLNRCATGFRVYQDQGRG